MAAFLETWGPLRKFRKPVRDAMGNLSRPSIHMHCGKCESEQTFTTAVAWWDRYDKPHEMTVAKYTCAGCGTFGRVFFLEFGSDASVPFVRKLGQKPDWQAPIDPQVAGLLGTNEVVFR